jgi:hypothetical protein
VENTVCELDCCPREENIRKGLNDILGSATCGEHKSRILPRQGWLTIINRIQSRRAKTNDRPCHLLPMITQRRKTCNTQTRSTTSKGAASRRFPNLLNASDVKTAIDDVVDSSFPLCQWFLYNLCQLIIPIILLTDINLMF